MRTSISEKSSAVSEGFENMYGPSWNCCAWWNVFFCTYLEMTGKIFSFTGLSIQILWNFLIPFLLFLAQEVVPRIYKQLPHLFTSTPSIVIMHWNQSPFSQAPWTILWFLLIISSDLVEIAYLNWIPLIRNVLQLIWYLKKKFKSKNWWPLPGRNGQQIYSIY